MNARYDLLVFDWDGTLFDSIGWIVECLQHAARETGLAVPAETAARSVIGLSLHQAMQVLYPGSSDELARQLAGHYSKLYHSRSTDSLGLFEGVEDMLSAFREQGYQLAVATGKARAGLDHALSGTGVGGLFHATRCADETASKPHPLMVHQLMEELGVVRERTLLVGDSLHDLQMAHNAGVDVVAVACGANTRSELAELNPLICLEKTAELLMLFDQETE
jgi:phosphoglycolate phosphatase